MDKQDKARRADFDNLINRQVPSQIPFVVIKETYQRMLKHCMTQDVATADLWACKKNGARVHMRVVRMNIFDRATGALIKMSLPVGYLFCSGCDKVPDTHADDAIYSDQLQTLAV